MNFYSNHSLSNKTGIIYSLTDRVISLSNKKYRNENLKLAKETQIKNRYPLDLLSGKIPKNINFLYKVKTLTESQMILQKLLN